MQAAGPRFENDTITRAYFDEVLRAVRAVPGVQAAAFTSQLPLSEDFDAFGVKEGEKNYVKPEERVRIW